MNKIIAAQGQRLDQIFYAHYTANADFIAFLKANKNVLANIILTGGEVINLPPLATAPKINQQSPLLNAKD